MKNVLNTIPALLTKGAFVSLILGGCTTSSPQEKVTVENAPSELLKQVAQVNSATDPAQTEDLIFEMIQATQQSYDQGLVFTETICNQKVDKESDTLKAETKNYASYEIRMGKEKSFYELSELQTEDESLNSLMEIGVQTWSEILFESADQSSLWANPNAKIKVMSIKTEEVSSEELEDFESLSEEDLAEAFAYMSIYPLAEWFGQNLTIQPLVTPEQYDFSLVKAGEDYIWTITLTDFEAYTTLYNENYQSVYGVERTDVREDGSFMLDAYECEKVLWTITMDQNGSLKKLEFSVTEKATKGEESLALTSSNVYTIDHPLASWADFFKDFFEKVQNGTIKEGTQLTLFDLQSLSTTTP